MKLIEKVDVCWEELRPRVMLHFFGFCKDRKKMYGWVIGTENEVVENGAGTRVDLFQVP